MCKDLEILKALCDDRIASTNGTGGGRPNGCGVVMEGYIWGNPSTGVMTDPVATKYKIALTQTS